MNDETWQERFALLWGEAPQGTPKYDKGQAILAFITAEKAASEQSGHERGYAEGKKEMAEKIRKSFQSLPPFIHLRHTKERPRCASCEQETGARAVIDFIDQSLHQD